MPNGFSFPPFRRIRERLDFQRTFQQGKSLYSLLYILYYRPNNLKYPRIGVIISKRNARKAVKRNQIRRLVRETFRLQQSVLPSVDMVIVVRKIVNYANKEERQQCLEQLFTKLK